MNAPNLYAPVPAGDAEHTDVLLATGGVRVERIVSHGQASPPGFWYDQPQTEWVAVLAGAAALRFADAPDPLLLRPGDHVTIVAHRRHRVDWTDPLQPTVWLAVHVGSAAPSVA